MDKKLPTVPVPRDPPEADQASLQETLRLELEAAIGPLIQGKSRDQVVERATAVLSKEIFKGPLPHPKHLQAYEAAQPGAADRIIAMAEKQLSINISTTEKVLQSDITYRRVGQILGFVALMVILACAAFCAAQGNNVGAGLFLATGVLGVVFKFIDGPSFKGRNDDADGEE
jgi:uncharacterized membrane protein